MELCDESLFLVIDNIGRMWLLGLPKKQNGHPFECITRQTLTYQTLQGVHPLKKDLPMVYEQWQASWTVNWRQILAGYETGEW